MTTTTHAAGKLAAVFLLLIGGISTSAHADFSLNFAPLEASRPQPATPSALRGQELPPMPVQQAPAAAQASVASPAPDPAVSSSVAAAVAPAGAPAASSALLPPNAKPDEAVAMEPVETWVLSPADGTMRSVLGKWASKAGWQLSWEAAEDVPLTLSASFTGDFRSAVKQLFKSLSASEVNLTGLLYTRNRVLRVTEIGQRSQ